MIFTEEQFQEILTFSTNANHHLCERNLNSFIFTCGKPFADHVVLRAFAGAHVLKVENLVWPEQESLVGLSGIRRRNFSVEQDLKSLFVIYTGTYNGSTH
jgi:hypothetical protein